MGYLFLAYGIIGLLAYVWYVPRYLRRQGIKSGRPGARWLEFFFTDPLAAMGLLFWPLAAWPIVVPIWIWIERDAQQKQRDDAAFRKRECEARAKDKHHDLTFEQKLELLGRLAAEENTETKPRDEPR